jgi:hypothetical protein
MGKKYGIDVFEISAKDNINIIESFVALTRLIKDNQKQIEVIRNPTVFIDHTETIQTKLIQTSFRTLTAKRRKTTDTTIN